MNDLEVGKERHIKGFILNKLYLGGYFCGRGRKHHRKHTSIKNLPKGYPLEHRDKFPKIIGELRRGGFIVIFPSTRDKHVCAVRDPEKIDTGLSICNAYRKAVKLMPLNKRFKEVLGEK